MEYAVAEGVRPPETAEWLPAGFRAPPTRWLRGRLDEVSAGLPGFDRAPFAFSPECEGPWHPNELLDLVATRESAGGDWLRRPVAVVPRGWRLLGHREVAGRLAHALEANGIEAAGLDTHATLDRYGAALALQVHLPAAWMTDPGDGHPLVLQLRCLHAVDTAAAPLFRFTWYRLVCTNGLVAGFTGQGRRAGPRDAHRAPGLAEELAEGLAAAKADRLAMARWLERGIDPARLVPFADGPLRECWGALDAARFLHIARTGFDAGFEDRFQPGLPSGKRMAPTVAVPGSPPVARCEWDAAQALSWIARDRREPAAQLDRLQEIPALVSRLAARGGARQR